MSEQLRLPEISELRYPAREAPIGAVESWLDEQGVEGILGVDEVGRGPLAGPVVAAAVMLPYPLPRSLEGLDDSKRLSARRRELFSEQIREQAWAWGIGWIEPERIDEINIRRGALEAMMEAILEANETLSVEPQLLLVDGNTPLPSYQGAQKCLVKGDRRSLNIAAASVLAKVARDYHMEQMDLRYPGYGFAAHKGYGTPQHRRALTQLGACPIHRQSFRWKPL